jgi:hypothetical protein
MAEDQPSLNLADSVKITVSRGTATKLRHRGVMGQSYDQILTEILGIIDEVRPNKEPPK